MTDYDGGRNQAKRLFKYYMCIFMDDHHEFHTTSDNRSEWDFIIDCIMDGAKREIKKELAEEDDKKKEDVAEAEDLVRRIITQLEELREDNRRMRAQLELFVRWSDDIMLGRTLASLVKSARELLSELDGE